MNPLREASALLGIGFDGPAVTDTVRAFIAGGGRCVILFDRNHESREQLAALCAELHAIAAAETPDDPLLICVDHEGGRVQRFRSGFSAVPSARIIGGHGPPARAAEAAAHWGRVVGRELRAVGIDLNLAPVADVDTNPENPVIADRAFSNDAQRVAICVEAFVRAQQGEGVAACAKHFPGHGDTLLDSHLHLPRITHGRERLERTELPPFRSALEAGVAAIMTAHVVFDIVDPARPATLSRHAVEGELRSRLGFDGLVVSDDMEMKAVADHFGLEPACVDAVNAGCDLLLVCNDPASQRRAAAALSEAIALGRIDEARVAEARRRRRAVSDRFVVAAR